MTARCSLCTSDGLWLSNLFRYDKSKFNYYSRCYWFGIKIKSKTHLSKH